MLIVMKAGAAASDIERVLEVIEALGFRGHALPGEHRTAIGVTGNPGSVDPAHFENLPGVADAIRVTKPYKLISKDLRPEKSVVKVGNATIGGPRTRDHRWALCTRESQAGFRDRRNSCSERSTIFPRRSL